MGFFDRLREGLSRTTQQIVQKFDAIAGATTPGAPSRAVDVETFDALEELLIPADVGMGQPSGSYRPYVCDRGTVQNLRELVKDEIRSIFSLAQTPAPTGHSPQGMARRRASTEPERPRRSGKLANLLKSQGARPLICAADTYGAAAVEQLEIWAERAGVDSCVRVRVQIRQPWSSTPSSQQRRKAAMSCSSTLPDACIRVSI